MYIRLYRWDDECQFFILKDFKFSLFPEPELYHHIILELTTLSQYL